MSKKLSFLMAMPLGIAHKVPKGTFKKRVILVLPMHSP
jgi:hypothetical protein